jgi:ATP-dependent Clp protease ATP-binding subunit ClpX
MTCKLCPTQEIFTLKKHVLKEGKLTEIKEERIPLCSTCLEKVFDEFVQGTGIGVIATNKGTKIRTIVNLLNTDPAITYNVWLQVAEKLKPAPAPIITSDIAAKMKERVIGQDHCVDKLVYIYDRYLLSKKNKKIKKNNLMITGDTGTGKTEMVESFARLVDIPVYSVNCATLTPTGYKGSNVSDIIGAFMSEIGSKDAIIYLDEIDKFTGEADFDRKSIQMELLKIIEGETVTTTDKHETSTYDTSNILFIASGSFPAIKQRKLTIRKEVGLMSNYKAVAKRTPISADDFFGCGLIPEFIGRFQSFVETNEMTEELLMNIINLSSNSPLLELTEIATELDKTIEIDKKFLAMIIKRAVTQKTGARGIKQALDGYAEKLFYFKKKHFKIRDESSEVMAA